MTYVLMMVAIVGQAPVNAQQMADIKSGARDNGMTVVMKPIMANVTEDEMAAIAEWLSETP